MRSRSVVLVLSFVIGAVGLISAIGWVFGIPALIVTFMPGTITMKFVTSLSFIASSLTLWALASRDRQLWKSYALLFFTAVLLFLMGGSFVATLIGLPTGVEVLVREDPGAAATHFPGAASVATSLSFLLFAAVVLLNLLDVRFVRQAYQWVGTALVVIDGLPLVGYAFDVPVLYYDLGWTNPISLRAATLLVLLGVALLLLAQCRRLR